MARPNYEPSTLHQLIDYVKDRRRALIASRDLAASYSGPDPSPQKTAADASAIETLTGVLEAIRDIETKRVKRTIAADLGLN